MNTKILWRTAATLGGVAVLGYAGAVLIRTTPFDVAGQAQMPGMEHEAPTPGKRSTEPNAEMEHEAGEREVVGHDMSPVDVWPGLMPAAISCSSPDCATASRSLS
jgi:hypothetical protein